MPATPGFYSRVFALAVAAILGYALLLIFRPFALPMTWAAFLAFLLFPLNVRLRRRFKVKSLSAGVLTVLAPIVILLPLSALSVEFVSQISALLRQLQQSATQMDIQSFSDLQQFPWIARINTWLQTHADISAEQLQSWLVSGTREVMQRAASWGGSFFLGALGSLLSFAIMLFLLFFFLRDGDFMISRARRLIPLAEDRKERLFSQLGAVTRAIVFGTTVTALLQGLLLAVGFAFAGLPSPFNATRYHSLIVSEDGLPEELQISARAEGLIMGLRHRNFPIEGVQFHPESVLTDDGQRLIANFLKLE